MAPAKDFPISPTDICSARPLPAENPMMDPIRLTFPFLLSFAGSIIEIRWTPGVKLISYGVLDASYKVPSFSSSIKMPIFALEFIILLYLSGWNILSMTLMERSFAIRLESFTVNTNLALIFSLLKSSVSSDALLYFGYRIVVLVWNRMIRFRLKFVFIILLFEKLYEIGIKIRQKIRWKHKLNF